MKKVFWELAGLTVVLFLLSGCSDIAGFFSGVTGVSFKKTSYVVGLGATIQLDVAVDPSSAQDRGVSWRTSDPSVATVTGAGLVTGKAYGTATITARANDHGKEANCSLIVSDQFVSYSFDEAGGTTAYDGSGNGNDGTLVSVGRVQGKVGRAVSFPLLGSRLFCVDIPRDFGGSVSIDCWFTLPVVDMNAVYPILSAPSYNDLSLMVRSGKAAFAWNAMSYVTSSTQIVPNTWYYLVVTSDGNATRLYIDGILESTNPISFPLDFHIGPYVIGANQNFDFVDNFGGAIDEFRWWKKALTAEEIATEYNLKK